MNFNLIYFFQDQPYILLIKAAFLNSSIFEIKTNRFVGSRFVGKSSLPVDFYTLQRYDAKLKAIIWNSGIDMSSKIQDLQGREIVTGVFTYKPFMLLDYVRRKQWFSLNCILTISLFSYIKRTNNLKSLIAPPMVPKFS